MYRYKRDFEYTIQGPFITTRSTVLNHVFAYYVFRFRTKLMQYPAGHGAATNEATNETTYEVIIQATGQKITQLPITTRYGTERVCQASR